MLILKLLKKKGKFSTQFRIQVKSKYNHLIQNQTTNLNF